MGNQRISARNLEREKDGLSHRGGGGKEPL